VKNFTNSKLIKLILDFQVKKSKLRFSGTFWVKMSGKKLGTFGPVTKKLSEAWIAKLGSINSLLPESSVQV